MLLDISDLDPGGLEFDQKVDLEPFAWEGGDLVRTDSTRIVGRIKPTRRGLELVARFTTVAHVECARCLAPVDRPMDREFRLFLLPPLAPSPGPKPGRSGGDGTGQPPDDAYEPIPDDDPDAIDLYPLDEPAVDLGDVLREQVDLALPARALCREECRGLCAGCGTDLNVGDCTCSRDPDARIGALRKIKSVLENRRSRPPEGGNR